MKIDLKAVITETGSQEVFDALPEWKKNFLETLSKKGFTNATIVTQTEVSKKMQKKLLKADGIEKVYCRKSSLYSINRDYRAYKAKLEGKEKNEVKVEKRPWGRSFGNNLLINDWIWTYDKKTKERVEKLPNKIYIVMYVNSANTKNTVYFDQDGRVLDEVDVEKYWTPSSQKDYGHTVKDYRNIDINNIVGVKYQDKWYGEKQ
jgi:hypothetical protein